MTGAVLSMAVRAFGICISYAANIVLSRTLGLEAYGFYVIALSWGLVMVLPARAGFDLSALRYVTIYLQSKNYSALTGFLRVAMATIGAVSICVGLLLFLGHALWGRSNSPEILWASLLILPLALLSILSVVMRSARRIVASQFYDQVLRPSLLILLLGAMIWGGAKLSPSSGLAMTAVAAFAALIALFIHLRIVLREALSAPPDYSHWRSWFRLSVPMLLIALVQEFMNQIEVILLGVMANSREAGLFAAAWRVASLVPFVLSALAVVTGPLIVSAYERHARDELAKIATLTARVASVFSLIMVAVLAFGGQWLLRMFGAEFLAAFPPLMILLIGGVVNAFTGVVTYLMTLTGRERAALGALTAALVISLGLNVLLIPYFQATGAAIASTSATSVWNIAMTIYVRRKIGIDASLLGLPPREFASARAKA